MQACSQEGEYKHLYLNAMEVEKETAALVEVTLNEKDRDIELYRNKYEEFLSKYNTAKARVEYLDGEVARLVACAGYHGVSC